MIKWQARRFTQLVLLLVSILATNFASAAQSLVIGGVTIERPGRTDLRIEIPAGSTDPATFIPVSVLRGAKAGPTLLMVAGVHGFEFTSILGAERLADEIAPDELAGTFIIVRVANVAAYEQKSTHVNPYDRKNLNRSFPGRADGTQTERIAHALSTELIAKADFVIDAHNGDGAEWLASFAGIYGGPLASDFDTALGVARAMGLPNIVRYTMNTQAQIDTGRSLNRQAVAAGLPTVLIEIGENGERDPQNVDALLHAIRATLIYLEMLPGELPPAATSPRYFESTTSVPASYSGLWHPLHLEGRDVLAGELLGVIRDYSGKVVERIRAPVSGFALYGAAGPPVRAGDSLMQIARPVESFE
ncbi:MAG: hypothetical protein Cons2KO_01000 [Congregibacter sp.]